MSLTPLDRQRLLEALELAHQSIGLSDPNPRVGCLIGNPGGQVFASGFTQQAGGPHAEAFALAQARAGGLSLQGATVWVTLEPCAHHGRTPPCADALVSAGVARVVVGMVDPNPRVRGQGLDKLRAAGIEVTLADASFSAAASELNVGFFSRMETGRPWIRLKCAMSLDGKVALPDGRSQWITGEPARDDGHRWRRRSSAIVTGVGTVLADNPQLTVRSVPTHRQPMRVVVDTRLRTPINARVLSGQGTSLIATTAATTKASAALRATVECVELPLDAGGRVSLPHLFDELARREVNEVLVEAGAALNGALLEADLVDEVLLYLAPKLLGPGLPFAQFRPLDSLAGVSRFAHHEATRLGDDLRLRLVRKREARRNPLQRSLTPPS